MKTRKTNKKGISLIVLVITLTSTYDEANKIDRFPPNDKMKIIKLININKVTGNRSVTFNFFNHSIIQIL